ncbi:MAG: protein YgfX [Pseudomonadota bacterium]
MNTTSSASDAPILLMLPQASPSLRRRLLLGHGIALGAAWLAALPAWASVLLTLFLLASAWRFWHGAPKTLALQWAADGAWQVQNEAGQWQAAQLQAMASRSWPWWVHLHFRLEDGRGLPLTLFADSLPRDVFRRLRVRLRCEIAGLMQDQADDASWR